MIIEGKENRKEWTARADKREIKEWTGLNNAEFAMTLVRQHSVHILGSLGPSGKRTDYL